MNLKEEAAMTSSPMSNRPIVSARDPAESPPKSTLKEDRARDAAQAMRQYEDEERALLVRTEQLRALRLAQPASVSPANDVPWGIAKAPGKAPGKAKTSRKAKAKRSDDDENEDGYGAED
jgi:hypothetical protein